MRLDGRRVMVTGAAGQLGSVMVKALADAKVIPFTRATLDITDTAAVARAVADAAPDVVINCAAFNDVDGAESAAVDALNVNTFAVRALARATAAAGATLVHYSTDFVFDGRGSAPYEESVPPSPQSIYAASKLLGEWFAADAPRHFVLRVESLFGTPRGWTGRRGTLDGIVAQLEAGRDVRVFTDRIVSPSYTVDIAAATRHLLESDAASGIYHCVNDGHASWHEVAGAAARLLGIEPQLIPASVNDVQFKARRPQFCALSVAKLAATGFRMPHWSDALQRWLAGRAQPAT